MLLKLKGVLHQTFDFLFEKRATSLIIMRKYSIEHSVENIFSERVFWLMFEIGIHSSWV